MSVHRKGAKWIVRYRDGDRNRSRAFDRKTDAHRWDAEVTRRRQLGVLASLEAGSESLDDFVVNFWAPTHAVTLAPKTRQTYAGLYDHHLAPYLGGIALRDLKPDVIARWQADRINAGAGRTAIRQALDLLGSILQRAVKAERITTNPARLVRRAKSPRRKEVRPLAPITVERMRAAASRRDATLFSVLAYAGLRPSEALALRWGDVRANTFLIERALSLGNEDDPKTTQHRTVRLLAPLKADLQEWRLAQGRPDEDALLFPGHDYEPISVAAYQSWRRRSFGAARKAAGIDHTTPYALRHSFASLLLHEGRSVIYVARQLGHDARLTLTRYGHVIDELEDEPRISAQDAIRNARARVAGGNGNVPSPFPANASAEARRPPQREEPPINEGSSAVELGRLELPTSWVRSRPTGVTNQACLRG